MNCVPQNRDVELLSAGTSECDPFANRVLADPSELNLHEVILEEDGP